MPQYYENVANPQSTPQGTQCDYYMANDLGYGFHVTTVNGAVTLRSRDDELLLRLIAMQKVKVVPAKSLPPNVLEAFSAFLDV